MEPPPPTRRSPNALLLCSPGFARTAQRPQGPTAHRGMVLDRYGDYAVVFDADTETVPVSTGLGPKANGPAPAFIRQVRCRATRCRLAWNTASGLVSSHVGVSCTPAQSAPIGHFGSCGRCPGSGLFKADAERMAERQALDLRRQWSAVARGRPCANRCRVCGAMPRSVLAPPA